MKYSIVITNREIPELKDYLLKGSLNKYYISELDHKVDLQGDLIYTIKDADLVDNITLYIKHEEIMVLIK